MLKFIQEECFTILHKDDLKALKIQLYGIEL